MGARSSSIMGRREASSASHPSSWPPLPGCGLKFTVEQLRRLNLIFVQLDRDSQKGWSDAPDAPDQQQKRRANLELFARRIMRQVAARDPRFSCRWLMSTESPCEDTQVGEDEELELVVRLDQLSSPVTWGEEIPGCRLVDGDDLPEEDDSPYDALDGGRDANWPPGHVQLRAQGPAMESFAEYICPRGFICSDLLLDAFYHLVSQVVQEHMQGGGHHSDESDSKPPYVMDADVLQEITAEVPTEEHLLLVETGSADQTDFTDWSVEVIEEVSAVKIRIVSPDATRRSTFRFLLGVAMEGWPRQCDFPQRVPLGHLDALPFHHSALLGFYCIPGGEESASGVGSWRLYFPASRSSLLAHYGPESAVATTLRTLRVVVAQLGDASHPLWRSGCVGDDAKRLPPSLASRFKVLTRDALDAAFLFALENSPDAPGHSDHPGEEWDNAMDATDAWRLERMSARVLGVLDLLMVALLKRQLRSFFVPGMNVLAGRRGTTDEDYDADASVLRHYMKALHELSYYPSAASGQSDLNSSGSPEDDWVKELCLRESLEKMLLEQWRVVQRSLLRTRRPLTSATSVASDPAARLQLEYVTQVMDSVLRVKQAVRLSSEGIILPTCGGSRVVADVLGVVLAQLGVAATRTNMKNYHPRSTRIIAQALLHEAEANCRSSVTRVEDLFPARTVIGWLSAATRTRPFGAWAHHYLRMMCYSAAANACFLQEYRKRNSGSEVGAARSLARFLSSEKEADFRCAQEALSDAAAKGWGWAQATLQTPARLDGTFVLVVEPMMNHVLAFNLLPTSTATMTLTKTSSTISALLRQDHRDLETLELVLRGLPLDRNVSCKRRAKLLEGCPLAASVASRRRQGYQRGLGSIVGALVTLRSFGSLRQVATVLPEKRAQEALAAIQRLSRGSERSLARSRRMRASDATQFRDGQVATFRRRNHQQYASFRDDTNDALETSGARPLNAKVRRAKSLHNLFRRSAAGYQVNRFTDASDPVDNVTRL